MSVNPDAPSTALNVLIDNALFPARGYVAEFCEFAGHDASDVLFQLERVRSIQRHRFQGAEATNPLFGAAQVAIVGDAIYAGPHQEKRLAGGHRHIGVERVGNAGPLDITHAGQVIRPRGVEPVGTVIVCKCHWVVRVPAHDGTQSFNTRNLFRRRDREVNDHSAVVGGEGDGAY